MILPNIFSSSDSASSTADEKDESKCADHKNAHWEKGYQRCSILGNKLPVFGSLSSVV